jgi:hypothetical protein
MPCNLPLLAGEFEGLQWVGFGRPYRAAVGHEMTSHVPSLGRADFGFALQSFYW